MKTQKCLVSRQRSGFTLVELLLVIVVIGILAGLILRSAKYVKTRVAIAQCKAEMTALSAAVESYYKEMGAYPRDSGVLVTELVGRGKKYIDWPANRIAGDSFLDPWGKAYTYQAYNDIHPDNTSGSAGDVLGIGAVCFRFGSRGPDGVQSDDDLGTTNLKDN